MPFWLCVQTSFTLQVASPNAGYPFVVESDESPGYIRVLGPFDTEELANAANIVPFNPLEAPAGPNTTKGFYAYCAYNSNTNTAVVAEFDNPPTRLIATTAYGPYDTEELAQAKADTMFCSKSFTPAFDVCDPTPRAKTNPDLECSLVCSSLQWPQQSGTIQVKFYANVCGEDDPLSSPCLGGIYQIPLGCAPSLEPVQATCWNGYTGTFNVALITDPPRGYTLRMSGTMCIDPDSNFVTVSVALERLVNPVDLDPNNPPDLPVWSNCGSFGGRIPITTPQPDKTKNRIYVSDLEGFNPSCAGLSGCVQYVQYSVFLIPQQFGCDGTANGGPLTTNRCNMSTNMHAYSCMSALIEPLAVSPVPAFRAQFVQMGANATTSTEEHGCFYVTQPTAGNYVADPSPKFFSANSIGGCGCPSDDVVGATQQIQFGKAAGFQVFVKRVNGGSFCVGMRRGDSDTWVVKSGADITHIQDSIPYVDVIQFSTFNAKLTIYMLQFPSPEIAGCYNGNEHPPTTGPWPYIEDDALVYDPSDSSYLVFGADGSELKPYDIIVWQKAPVMMDAPAMAMEEPISKPVAKKPLKLTHSVWTERMREPCIYAGKEIETVAGCGCSGKPMKECSKFGVCRTSGVDWDTRSNEPTHMNPIQLCLKCDDYTRRS
jgi:hypothetical protein